MWGCATSSVDSLLTDLCKWQRAQRVNDLVTRHEEKREHWYCGGSFQSPILVWYSLNLSRHDAERRSAYRIPLPVIIIPLRISFMFRFMLLLNVRGGRDIPSQPRHVTSAKERVSHQHRFKTCHQSHTIQATAASSRGSSISICWREVEEDEAQVRLHPTYIRRSCYHYRRFPLLDIIALMRATCSICPPRTFIGWCKRIRRREADRIVLSQVKQETVC